jgi:retron-type reverse transcriptase
VKRAGQLFERLSSVEALLAAYRRASDRKRGHRACFNFTRNLGANIHALAQELASGSYRPRPCNRFWVLDGPKPRLIEAPAFRDLVVQHAVYAAVGPVLERRFIDTSFACRTGYGTHRAADWLQAAMRRAPRSAWVLHVDVRKFFYSIDRQILQGMLERVIKCRPTLALMAQLAWRDAPTGIPIGNLLSQVLANVYLNSLDHFCKRTLQVRDYARYMDDSIMIAPSREVGAQWLAAIEQHLALLNMELSHHSLQPIQRGANFVGFRTWATARFVRPRVIAELRRDARRGRVVGVVSRLGHARRTCSFRPLLTHLQDAHPEVYRQLPASFLTIHNTRRASDGQIV